MRREHSANPDQQPQQQVAVLPAVGEVSSLVVVGAKRFARANPVLTGSYLFGIAVLLFFSSGIPLTREQHVSYQRILDTIDLQAEYDASHRYWQARQAYLATKGWFFSCDSLCQRNKQRMTQAEQQLNLIRQEGEARMRDAKQTIGVFSSVAAEEIKDSFWQYFTAGKQFAKRQSMWDLFFLSIRSMRRGRDETMIEFALKILLQVLVNFSVGLALALVMFVVGLYSLVRAYASNPIAAVVAFCSAALAAFAFVTSYLLAVYGAAAASVYSVLKLAETSAQARLAQERRQGQRVEYRPHYE